MTPREAELDAVGSAFSSGGRPAAEAELFALERAHPGSSATLAMRWRVLVAVGEDAEAERMLDGNLCGDERDVGTYVAIAELAWDRADRGPTVHYGSGVITARPRGPGDPDPDVFRRDQLARASAALRHAIELDEGDPNLPNFLGLVELARGSAEGARRAYDACLALAADAAPCLIGRGRALAALGRFAEARDPLEAAVRREPRNAQAREVLARVLRETGDVAGADAQAGTAEFYAYLPGYLDAEPTPANQRVVACLAVDETRRREPAACTRSDAIAELVARVDDDATAILAAFVHHHSHDALEERAFEALVARGRYDTVLALLENGESACTIRRSAESLAQAHRTEALEAMLARLPNDVLPMHPMGIPEALAQLADSRAVPALVEAVDLEPPPELDSFASFAYDMLRGRAALALARFPPDASSDAALRRAASARSTFVSVRARAALAIRGDAAMLTPLCAALESAAARGRADDDDRAEPEDEVTEALTRAGLRCRAEPVASPPSGESGDVGRPASRRGD